MSIYDNVFSNLTNEEVQEIIDACTVSLEAATPSDNPRTLEAVAHCLGEAINERFRRARDAEDRYYDNRAEARAEAAWREPEGDVW